jgi:hypothetical protein
MILTANLFYVQYAWEKEGSFQIFTMRMDNQDPAYQYINSVDVEVDVPDDFTPKNSKKAHLDSQKAELMDKLAEVEKKMEALEC